MFLLDTNVISELRRPDKANRAVVAWAGAIPAASVFLSAISILEIELGALPPEDRISVVEDVLDRMDPPGLTPAPVGIRSQTRYMTIWMVRSVTWKRSA